MLLLVLGACVSVACGEKLPDQILAQLKNEDFKLREIAQAQLLEWARKHSDTASKLLLEQVERADSPEVRERCREVLRPLIDDLYLRDGKGFVGIRMQDVKVTLPGETKERIAVQITDVIRGLAADKAGLIQGDMILGVDGKPLAGQSASEAMRRAIMGMKPSTVVKLRILHEGKQSDVKVTLGRRPLTADNPMLEMDPVRAKAAEQAARDEYFRRWLEEHKSRK